MSFADQARESMRWVFPDCVPDRIRLDSVEVDGDEARVVVSVQMQPRADEIKVSFRVEPTRGSAA